MLAEAHLLFLMREFRTWRAVAPLRLLAVHHQRQYSDLEVAVHLSPSEPVPFGAQQMRNFDELVAEVRQLLDKYEAAWTNGDQPPESEAEVNARQAAQHQLVERLQTMISTIKARAAASESGRATPMPVTPATHAAHTGDRQTRVALQPQLPMLPTHWRVVAQRADPTPPALDSGPTSSSAQKDPPIATTDNDVAQPPTGWKTLVCACAIQ